MAQSPRETIVLQSMRPPPWPRWIGLCLETVADWADRRGHARLFLDDSLFDPLPPAFRALCGADRLLAQTDFARLLWIRRLHEEGWKRVIWLDADILVADPDLDLSRDGVGREAWISRAPGGGHRVTRSANNCVLSFAGSSPEFERYRAAAEALAAALSDKPGPMAFGPDLLSDLHRERPFPLIETVAMFSPRMIDGLAGDDDAALRAHHAVWRGPVKAANLCASRGMNDDQMLRAAQAFLRDPGRLSRFERDAPEVAEAPRAPGEPPVW